MWKQLETYSSRLNLYRLSPLSGSRFVIGTQIEKVNFTLCKEEIVSTIRNNGDYVGEQDPEELAECLLEPATRNVAQITVEDATAADNLFEIFMGSAVPPRREYILKHSEEAEI